MHTNPPKNQGEYPAPSGDIVDYPEPGAGSIENGYETTDVNVGGIMVFIGGLFGFVLVFFVFCFLMGKLINKGLETADGPIDKWHVQERALAGISSDEAGHKRENLKSSTAMQQQELQQMTATFPSPRLDVDDGNQATADLHAREDLLLDHYSTAPAANGQGTEMRIPIDRAMELVVSRGLPVTAAATAPPLAGDQKTAVKAPLTSGFARTGYELDTIEARKQKMMFNEAQGKEHAELKPVR